MKTAQTMLTTGEPEFCEHIKHLNNVFVCELTDFGLLVRCLKSDKADCPDLEYFLIQQKKKLRGAFST